MAAEHSWRPAIHGQGLPRSTAGCELEFGIPAWSGDPLRFEAYEKAVLWYRAGLKDNERPMAVARLWAALKGAAKEAVKDLMPSQFDGKDGPEKLLLHLREGPLSKMPVPDAYQKIRAYEEAWRSDRRVRG